MGAQFFVVVVGTFTSPSPPPGRSPSPESWPRLRTRRLRATPGPPSWPPFSSGGKALAGGLGREGVSQRQSRVCVCVGGGRGQARREGRSHCTHRSRKRFCQQRSRTPGCPSARPNTRPRGGRGFPRPSKRASPPTGTASRYTSRRPPSPRGRRPSGPRRGRRRWRRRRFSGAPRSWKGRSGSRGRAA